MCTIGESLNTSADSGQKTPHRTPRDGFDLPWGTTYVGTGRRRTAVDAVLRTLEELKLKARVVGEAPRESAGEAGVWTLNGTLSGTRIEATQTAPWYRLLTGGLPQRAAVVVEGAAGPGPEEGGTGDEPEGPLRLTVDLTLAPWCRRLIVGFWITWAVALGGLFWSTEPGALDTGPVENSLFVAAVLIFLLAVGAVPVLLGAVGGGRMSSVLWQPLLDRVERDGGALEPEGTGISRRYGLWMLSYCLSFLLCGGGALALHGMETLWLTTPGGFWVLAVLSGIATLLLGLAVVAYLRQGLSLRLEPLVPALVSTITMILFLGLPFPLVAADGVVVRALAQAPDPEVLAWRAWMLLLETGAIGAVGLAAAAYLVSISLGLWLSVERTRSRRGMPGVYREALRGGPILALARAFFLAFAAGAAGLIFFGLLFAAAWAVQAVFPVWERQVLRLPEASGVLLALALGWPPGDPWALALARRAWVLWAAAGWAAFGISVGQLVWDRRRTRETLRRLAQASPPASLHRVRRLLDRLDGGSGARPVEVVVSGQERIGAESHRFGWRSGECYIEVSKGALKRLSDEELEAVLAHELVHLRQRHALRHDLARWLGRIAFLGDGFSRALLDTFGSEAEADRQAVCSYGVDPDALIRCLRAIRTLNSFVQEDLLAGGFPVAGLSFGSRSRFRATLREADSLPILQRWLVAWRYFVLQYFHLSRLHYWHPVIDERIERLERLGSTRQRSETGLDGSSGSEATHHER